MKRSFTALRLSLAQGSVHGRAYCHPKDSYGAAIAALKADIAKSLAARFDFLCEELDRRESDLKERKKKASSGMRVCGVCGVCGCGCVCGREEVRCVCVCVCACVRACGVGA
jgi:hypothetical protein